MKRYLLLDHFLSYLMFILNFNIRQVSTNVLFYLFSIFFFIVWHMFALKEINSVYIMIPFIRNFVRIVKPWANLFFRWLFVPKHWNCPLTMIARRSQRASHSSILHHEKEIEIFNHKKAGKSYLWEVSTIDCPFIWIFWIIFHKFLLATGSTPVLGSSRNISWGSPTYQWFNKARFKVLVKCYQCHCHIQFPLVSSAVGAGFSFYVLLNTLNTLLLIRILWLSSHQENLSIFWPHYQSCLPEHLLTGTLKKEVPNLLAEVWCCQIEDNIQFV